MNNYRANLVSGEFSPRFLRESDQAIRSFIDEYRVNDVLPKDAFESLDEAVQEPSLTTLRAVQDLADANLIDDIGEEGYFAATQRTSQRRTDVRPASIVMDTSTAVEGDRAEILTEGFPLPFIQAEFQFSERELAMASRSGFPLDLNGVSMASRRVMETMDDLVVNGDPDFSFNGNKVNGYTSAPNALGVNFSNGPWEDFDPSGGTGTPDGEDILADVLAAISKLKRPDATITRSSFPGPYGVYVSSTANTKLGNDFKANSDKSIRQRLEEIDSISFIQELPNLADGTVIFVQMTSNVVRLIRGFDPRPVAWATRGGSIQHWAVVAGVSIRIETDGVLGKSGVLLITAA